MSERRWWVSSMRDDKGEVVQPHSTDLRAAEWRTGLGAWYGLRQSPLLGLGGMEGGRRSSLHLRERLRRKSWVCL